MKILIDPTSSFSQDEYDLVIKSYPTSFFVIWAKMGKRDVFIPVEAFGAYLKDLTDQFFQTFY